MIAIWRLLTTAETEITHMHMFAHVAHMHTHAQARTHTHMQTHSQTSYLKVSKGMRAMSVMPWIISTKYQIDQIPRATHRMLNCTRFEKLYLHTSSGRTHRSSAA